MYAQEVIMRAFGRAIIFLGVAVAALPVARAQLVGEAKLQQMSQALKLTSDQKEKLRPILLDEASQVKQIRNNPTLSPEQKVDKELDVRQSYRQKIDLELSPSQLRQVKQLREREDQQVRARIKSEGAQQK